MIRGYTYKRKRGECDGFNSIYFGCVDKQKPKHGTLKAYIEAKKFKEKKEGDK